MRNDPLLLSLLACTGCGADLQLVPLAPPEPDGHIMSGELRCRGCSAVFPIRDGVPRCAPAHHTAEVSATVDAFGYEWSHSESFMQTSTLASAENFLQFIEPVTPDYFRDKVVLDGGCGSGRFTLMARQFGAKAVVGVDLSAAADVAFRSSRQYENVHILQADLFSLPLKAHCFDYVFSVGVLHHTADPRRAFDAVAKRAKPQGGVSAWVYGRENNGWIIYGLDPIRKHVTSRLPRKFLLALSYALGIPLFVALKGVYRPVGNSSSLRALRRVLPYFDYLYYLGQFDYRGQSLVILDHLVPALAEYIPQHEFAEWFRGNQLQQVVITSRAGNSWRGYAVQPTVAGRSATVGG